MKGLKYRVDKMCDLMKMETINMLYRKAVPAGNQVLPETVTAIIIKWFFLKRPSDNGGFKICGTETGCTNESPFNKHFLFNSSYNNKNKVQCIETNAVEEHLILELFNSCACIASLIVSSIRKLGTLHDVIVLLLYQVLTLIMVILIILACFDVSIYTYCISVALEKGH